MRKRDIRQLRRWTLLLTAHAADVQSILDDLEGSMPASKYGHQYTARAYRRKCLEDIMDLMLMCHRLFMHISGKSYRMCGEFNEIAERK